MNVYDFPKCCTAKVLACFEYEEDYQTNGQEWSLNAEKKESLVLRAMENIKNKLNMFKQQGMALVFACTTQKQTNTEEALARLGFYTSEPIEKRIHPKNKVTGWFMPLNEWEPS